jgi:hypothetical protein
MGSSINTELKHEANTAAGPFQFELRTRLGAAIFAKVMAALTMKVVLDWGCVWVKQICLMSRRINLQFNRTCHWIRWSWIVMPTIT